MRSNSLLDHDEQIASSGFRVAIMAGIIFLQHFKFGQTAKNFGLMAN